MLKKIAALVALIIAAFLIFAATRPDTFQLQRSAHMKAPPEKIYVILNDFHQWGGWSPWEKLDPQMKRTYNNVASGKGATYAWEGNSHVGQGSMEITESSAPSKLVLKLDFVKPLEGHNIVEFNLTPAGDGTDVTWAMHGPQPYIGKVLHLVFNMERMVGDQFETGLANLKALAEK